IEAVAYRFARKCICVLLEGETLLGRRRHDPAVDNERCGAVQALDHPLLARAQIRVALRIADRGVKPAISQYDHRLLRRNRRRRVASNRGAAGYEPSRALVKTTPANSSSSRVDGMSRMNVR